MPEKVEPPTVALAIPTLNGGELFGRVLTMWVAQSGVGDLQIICPDSGSSDQTRDSLRNAGGTVIDIPKGTFNHGATRDLALQATESEFVILSVQDALPLSTTVAQELVAPLLADPGLSATYGRQVPRAGCHPVLRERIDSWAGGNNPVVQELGDREWDAMDPFERLALIRYDHVIACIRRSAWEQCPFGSIAFGEDVNWAAHILRNGGRIAFAPAAVVEHSHDRTAWDEARRVYCDHRNLSRLVGLVTVPDRRRIPSNTQNARGHYRQLIDAQPDIDATTRANWHRWADRLALYENWAQYLGARWSHRLLFRPIDRWLRRHI
ncbi:MAG: glycosyltransferase [Planctomycetota bacterium]|jgi:rhamnosyltransferase|nr:glycosyltransferase [Planctomycetota bacterium]